MKKKVFFVLLIVSILIGSSIGAFFSYLRDLPQIKQLETFQPKTITKIYSDHDELIAEFFQENRVLVPLSKIPKHLKDAVLAVEDSRFYEYQRNSQGILVKYQGRQDRRRREHINPAALKGSLSYPGKDLFEKNQRGGPGPAN